MTVDERIAEFMQVGGTTTAAIVFLTTYRTGELRALLTTGTSLATYLREALICTLLPLLAVALLLISADIAIDAIGELTGKHGFSAPQASFVLFVALLVVLVVYQVILAVIAWKQWNKRRTDG
jgi:hypothetical protein